MTTATKSPPSRRLSLTDASVAEAIDRAFAPVLVPGPNGLERQWYRDSRPIETWLTLATARDVRRGDKWLPWHFTKEEKPA